MLGNADDILEFLRLSLRRAIMATSRRAENAVDPEQNTYVHDQNARVDPMHTLGTITVAGLRDILADMPDEAIVVVAEDGADGGDCSPLADVEEAWYFPTTGESAPLGRDSAGNVHEPGIGDLYAVILRPADQR
ncbi:hypothetical protein ACQP2E_04005 [Actinoplanes sp. CA-015351]|uniref:hypothetical protein n=1 Tax=Actinoplanes sp. CA-015351 TaxID=3239897 RepID=UPI003D959B8E